MSSSCHLGMNVSRGQLNPQKLNPVQQQYRANIGVQHHDRTSEGKFYGIYQPLR